MTVLTAALAIFSSCKMENPLLVESRNPYGAPAFDKIKNEHYLPAFKEAIERGKREIDEIVANPQEPTFENTIEALEYAGSDFGRICGIFYNLMECNTDDQMQQIAEELNPLVTEFEMYSSLNPQLFEKVKAVWDSRDSLDLAQDQKQLLEKTYKGFVRSGANLSEDDKKIYAGYVEELSQIQLLFGKHALAAAKAYTLNITDENDLAGLPDYVKEMGRSTALEKGLEGWAFTLDYPSYSPFMKYSENRELKKQLYLAYGTKAVGGENDNLELCKQIVDLRIKIANILGYEKYSDYALENKMAGNTETVLNFIDELVYPTLPFAKAEVKAISDYAKANGFEGQELEPWDFSYWSEKYQKACYDLDESALKPYFELGSCIDAVLGLATRLYGLQFEERTDIPKYHPDVKVFDVKDADGSHLALFYADFFPRESKRGGAWMTEFREQCIRDGVEYRPFISIVTNFTKPTGDTPSLLTHDELTTFLHEFGHALHGIMARGRYKSLAGTNVARDFVELPSQIMENWAFEKEYLSTFARHYQSGEVIPDELIDKIIASKNYLAAYSQLRQLQFGIIDMAWHTLTEVPAEDARTFEKNAIRDFTVGATSPETCTSATFGHIFTGGYSAGYYSYKWAEVLEADAFSLFEEKGIFNTEVSGAFRKEILEKGGTEDAAVIYRNFRGHDPKPEALMKKLGLWKAL